MSCQTRIALKSAEVAYESVRTVKNLKATSQILAYRKHWLAMAPQSKNGENHEEEAAETYCTNGLHSKHCFHWEMCKSSLHTISACCQ